VSIIDGLSSGLDTSTMIRQLMQLERQPQMRLAARRTQTENIASIFGGIRNDIAKLRSLAADLRAPGALQSLKATSSSPDVLASARSGQTAGSIDIRVLQTAAAKVIYTQDTWASLDTGVVPSSGPGKLYSFEGVGVLGFRSIAARAGANITDGSAITVAQSSAAAAVTGAQAINEPVTIVEGVNDQLTLQINGQEHTVQLAAGTYANVNALALGVNGALGAAGLPHQVRADVTGGRLRLSTVAEGSAMSLKTVSSSALGALRLAENTSGIGIDGRVSVNGTTTTVSYVAEGVTINMGGGVPPLLAATLSGGLRTGQGTVKTIHLTGTSLQDVVRAINTVSGLGYRAAAVNVGTGYRLQLTANDTGAHSTIGLDLSQVSSSQLATLTEGRDAIAEVVGQNPYNITSRTNTFTDLLPGLDVTVRQATAGPVTVSIQPALDARADKVKSLVDELNTLFKRIAEVSKADPNAASRGPLAGNSELRRLRQDLFRAFTDQLGTGSWTTDPNEIGTGELIVPIAGIDSAGSIGISVQRDGTLSFDRDKFLTVAKAHPDAVEQLLVGSPANATDGVLDRLVIVANAAASTSGGYLKAAEDGARNRMNDMTRQIDSLERRYLARELQYRRMFSGLETSLGRLQNQSGWLASALGPQSGSRP
jgi:flagellar hook-associated protein 2